MICGGYDKSWKHKTDCEIIGEDGNDKNINQMGMSLGCKPFQKTI